MNDTFRVLIAATALMTAGFCPAVAQQQQQPKAPNAPQPNSAQQPAAPGAAMPDVYRLNTMIRSSIIALNQANQTGNYTVLQDLAAPAFRATNDSARLAKVFAQLRQRHLDLSPILFFTPKLVQQPQIAPSGILRLVGYFPTSPERVNFDLYFQQIAGDWRIFGIGVSMSPAEVTAAIAPPVQPNGTGTPAKLQEREQDEKAAPNGKPPAPETPKQTAKNEKAPQPARKPAPAPKATPPAAKAESAATGTAVQNSTSNNATRIDLSDPRLQAQSGWKADEAAHSDGGQASTEKSFWDGLNPFGGN